MIIDLENAFFESLEGVNDTLERDAEVHDIRRLTCFNMHFQCLVEIFDGGPKID